MLCMMVAARRGAVLPRLVEHCYEFIARDVLRDALHGVEHDADVVWLGLVAADHVQSPGACSRVVGTLHDRRSGFCASVNGFIWCHIKEDEGKVTLRANPFLRLCNSKSRRREDTFCG